MTLPDPVPAGVSSLLKVGGVARVLNVAERRVNVWLERGALACIQPTGRSGLCISFSCEVA